MEQKQLTIIILIIGLLVGLGAGYMLAPKTNTNDTGEEVVTVTKAPLTGLTVQIGDILGSSGELETATPLDNEIILPEINALAEKLGYDVDFEILIDEASGQVATHLEKVQGFKSIDISILVGGRWSSMAQASLSYVDQNDMLLFSPSSTSPLLAIADDNLYRLCPIDNLQAPAIAEMLWSYGIEAVIIVQTSDAYGDGVYNIIETEYPARGGVILERIRYTSESTEYSNYLATAEGIAKDAIEEYGQEHVGVLLVATSGTVVISTQAPDFPSLYSLKWFGCDSTSLVQQFIDDASEQADHLKIFSTNASPGQSDKYSALDTKYRSLIGQQPGYYTTTAYDIHWLYATSILLAQSTDAVDIDPILSDVAYNYWGASGWCRLDENGDRYGSDYLIWGYGETETGEIGNVCYGIYQSDKGEVTWYADVLGYIPPGHS